MRIAIVGLNSDQVPYIQEAKALGLEVVGFDKQANPPGKSYCDSFQQVGYDELGKLRAHLKKMNFSEKDRLFTAASQSSHLALAKLAPKFGIPYPSFSAVRIVVSKFFLYPFLQKNSFPIPMTRYIPDARSLYSLPEEAFAESNYLKSDCSKNPNYVFKGSRTELLALAIPWERDRFLDKGYVLQPEFLGKHYRLNILGRKFEVYAFGSGSPVSSGENLGTLSQIAAKLIPLVSKLGMETWLLKFDIVLADDDYVVLDIGIDPPFRLMARLRTAKIPGEAYYLRHYLGIDSVSLSENFG